MSQILVLASSIVPLPGLPTNGGGLRGWTLARGLESAGHTVTLLFPRNSLDEQLVVIALEAREAALPHTFVWDQVDEVIARQQPDVVVASSWILAGQIHDCPVPLVVDVAGPVLVEFLAQSPEKGRSLAHFKTTALAAADYVICAGERQRPYFQPWLLVSGFTPDDCLSRLGVVPISCDPQPSPRGSPGAEPRFLYAGMANAWQNPTRALVATVAALDRRGRGQLIIHSDFHPIYSQGAGWFIELRQQFRDHPRVEFAGLLSYAEVQDAYGAADLAIDLFDRTLERELAFNTRTVDFLRAGLPPLYSDYAELSPLIRAYDAGFTIAPDDDPAITAAIELALDDPLRLAEQGRNAQRLARERLAWDRTIAPLAGFCAAPTRRQPGPLSPRAFVPDLLQLLEETQIELASNIALAEDRRTYARQLEASWAEQGTHLATLDAALAGWRRNPWRAAVRQTLDGFRTRFGGTGRART
jgi:glycosyltransferase involved in cell wall biosynthesis